MEKNEVLSIPNLAFSHHVCIYRNTNLIANVHCISSMWGLWFSKLCSLISQFTKKLDNMDGGFMGQSIQYQIQEGIQYCPPLHPCGEESSGGRAAVCQRNRQGLKTVILRMTIE